MLLRSLASFVILTGLTLSAVAQEPAKPLDRAALEKQFEATMSGCVLVGYFTSTKDVKNLKQEKYTISKVSKLKDDMWLFQVRIQYGTHDATIPMPLEVKWSGDTPVITLTDTQVPGFGKFTSRVLIYRDHYAGFWSSSGDNPHGGHLFGLIERAKEEKK